MTTQYSRPFELIFFLLFNVVVFYSKAQIAVWKPEIIQKIKGTTTYVIMENPDAPEVQPYLDVLKKYWTWSTIKAIPNAEAEQYDEQGNSFLVMQRCNSYTNEGVVMEKNFIMYLGLHYNKLPDSKICYPYTPAVIHFDTKDFPLLAEYYKEDHRYPNIDGYGQTYDWGPGHLKNRVQALMFFFESGEAFRVDKMSTGAKFHKTENLKKLRTATLFVPEDVLLAEYTEKVFKNYPLKYRVVPSAKLDEKILTNEKPFYYIGSTTTNYVSTFYIVNSQTGEIVYSDDLMGKGGHAWLWTNDVKAIYKEIMKD